MSDLKLWLERILNAHSPEEIFSTVEEFRPLSWSDEERASMAKTYNAKLYQFNMNNGSRDTKESEKSKKAKDSTAINKQNAGSQRGESLSSDKEMDEEEIG